jgi:DNA recombination protein RmuC
MEIILIIIGLFAGTGIGWLIASSKKYAAVQAEKDRAQQALNEAISLKDTKLAEHRDALAISNANLESAQQKLREKANDIEGLKKELSECTKGLNEANKLLATATADNNALHEKLETQKSEIEALGKKFNLEFENIANKILETKTEKFTELNRTNLKSILEPLGENIENFKKSVDEAYKKEGNERYSLAEKVKELAELNQQISKEARDLTRALKGEAKTQGRWGEMILESILEKSGLRKDEEYFMEHQLTDEQGQALRSDAEGKKMRPDAVIKYPDNRNVIIDSKVSLNAFLRYLETSDADEQKKELAAHVSAVKNHIVALSTRGYDDFDRSLDFVMMFIPSEPAYIATLQGDPDIWNFAYDKRILLLNPTNLITSLKLIVDLWKREKHNRNAREIAERGAKMYDKLVGFIANLEEVGKNLNKAQEAYTASYKQLTTGNDNLVHQATKMKDLGLKAKKQLPEELVADATGQDTLSNVM